MTHHMTDERLDELRALNTEEDIDGVSLGDLRSLLARLDAAEQEIQLARRERSILMDVVGGLTEEQLSAIPEGKLVLALRTMDEADKAADYHTFVDGIVKKLDAAEELIREVAHCCTNPEFYDERVKWSSVQINNDTIAQVRSYLR